MEGLRTESTDGVLRTTTISPGFVQTELADGMPQTVRDQVRANMHEFGIDPAAIARTIAFAIEQRLGSFQVSWRAMRSHLNRARMRCC